MNKLTLEERTEQAKTRGEKYPSVVAMYEENAWLNSIAGEIVEVLRTNELTVSEGNEILDRANGMLGKSKI